MHAGSTAKPGSLLGPACVYGNDHSLISAVGKNAGAISNLLPRAGNMTKNATCEVHTLLYEDPNPHFTDSKVPFSHLCFPNFSDRALSGGSNKSIPRLIVETHEYLCKLSMRHKRLKKAQRTSISNSQPAATSNAQPAATSNV